MTGRSFPVWLQVRAAKGQRSSSAMDTPLKYKANKQLVKDYFELRVPLSFPGATLKYSFLTAGYDISFGVYWESPHGDEHDLVAEARVESHTDPITGNHAFQASGGFVTLRWDNAYSWWRTKELAYTVTLTPPDPDTLRALTMKQVSEKMKLCAEDLTRAERRLARTATFARDLKFQLAQLQAQATSLQAQIGAKSKSLVELGQETAYLGRRIHAQRRVALPGLVLDLVRESGWLSGDDES